MLVAQSQAGWPGVRDRQLQVRHFGDIVRKPLAEFQGHVNRPLSQRETWEKLEPGRQDAGVISRLEKARETRAIEDELAISARSLERMRRTGHARTGEQRAEARCMVEN